MKTKWTRAAFSVGCILGLLLCTACSSNAGNECRYDSWKRFPWNASRLTARASSHPRPLESGPIASLNQLIYYSESQKRNTSIDEYIRDNCVIGLMILKDGRIVHETYTHGWDKGTAILSASTSKTILSLLVGIAANEGKLSLNSRVQEIFPEYSRSAFGPITIKNLLQMTSGVTEKIGIEPVSGSTWKGKEIDPFGNPSKSIYQTLLEKNLSDVNSEQGTHFEYANINSALLGLLVRKAVGKTATDYLQEKIWEPVGAEQNAHWVTNSWGEEAVGGDFLATLRDYAKLGLLIMNMGKVGGEQVVPSTWIQQMTTLRKDRPQPKDPPFYGLHVWLPVFRPGSSQMIGVSGQYIYVDPRAKIVILQFAAQKLRHGPGMEEWYPFRDAVVSALLKPSSN
jgi:CubicO group peptidase (beta-lactamase class C family)